MQTKLWHLDKDKNLMPQLKEAAELLQKGEVVAFPTETVYGLGANGLDGKACGKIFAAKGRPIDNPLILHIAQKEEIIPLTSSLSNNAKKLIETFWPGPLTLIVKKSDIIPREVTAGLTTVAIRMPDNVVAKALIEETGKPLAAPSANKSGKPSPTNAKAVLEDMEGVISGVIDGGECAIGVESTIVDTTTPVPTILRPGGITKEMLEDVLGAVDLDPGLTNENQTPKAPGMKYRHYAPEATMYLLEGAKIEEVLLKFVEEAKDSGNKVGVLADEETIKALVPQNRVVARSWGSSKEELAQKLYDYLRRFDDDGVDIIVAQGVEESGLGLAIMNRMRKAAGNNILTTKNGKLIVESGSTPSFL